MAAGENKKHTISIVMPVYNGETTIKKTLESLVGQLAEFREIIVVNDGSTDNSVKILEDFLKNKAEYKLINHQKSLGLASSYNDGIKNSQGELIVTLHQDVLLEKDSLQKLIKPFWDDKVVATGHNVIHPLEVWSRYNFWQKCFFARLAGKKFSGIDGKFDGFRKKALIKTGMFNASLFRSAGEDADLVFKLEKMGKIINTSAQIVHLHKITPVFSYADIIFKQKQYSESRGVLLRQGRVRSLTNCGAMFFREIMIILLFFPFVQYVSLALIMLYAFWYTKLVYLKNYQDPRILILPFFNIYLLLVSFIYSFKGFVYGRQKI